MLLAKHLDPKAILLDFDSSDPMEAAKAVFSALEKGPLYASLVDAGNNAQNVHAIEDANLLNTGHAATVLIRIPHLRNFLIGMARLNKPFIRSENESCQLVIVVVTPPENPHIALKIDGQFEVFMERPEFRDQMLSLNSGEAIHQLIQDNGLTLNEPIVARDFMRPPLFLVSPETPLLEVTQQMRKHRSNCVGVVDAEGRLIGQISSDLLFKLGIPEFLEQLMSVSFIRNFDPFEKYFAFAKNATAADVMSKELTTVNDDATLMEIVFLLTVKRNPKVFVLRNGIRVGVIDRQEVLNKILNI
jgi:CBS domain-containing protein